MTEEQLVEIRAHGTVSVVTLRREHKLNALSTALEGAIADALDDPRVQRSHCVVFTGGDCVFSAGADMGEMRDRDPASILEYYGATGAVYERVAALRQPTVAAIAGYCLGGGLELALACDFRVADATAVFGLPEVSIGILPSSGGTHRLVRLVGGARAKELLLLSRRFGVDEGLGLGLVTEAVAAGDALARALELAERLAALPPLAVTVAKQAIDVMPDAPHGVAIALERLAYGLLAQTADAREAADAFAEKRPPRFRGD